MNSSHLVALAKQPFRGPQVPFAVLPVDSLMALIPVVMLTKPVPLLSWMLDEDEHPECLNRLQNVVGTRTERLTVSCKIIRTWAAGFYFRPENGDITFI
jgi:hypothetical protein